MKASPNSACAPAQGEDAAGTTGSEGRRPGPLAWLLLLPVHLYRKVLSPLLPPSCRFYPSCSAYAVDALTRHGAVRGLLLTLIRLAKCAPWHPGGVDPVPERFTLRGTRRPGSSTEE